MNRPPPGGTAADLPGPLHDFVPRFLAFFVGYSFAGQHGRQFSQGVGEEFVNGSKYLGPGAVSVGPVFSSSTLISLQL